MGGGAWSGWIPPGTREICLCSRASAPADCDLESDDRRKLGVALSGVSLRAPDAGRRLGPDDAGWGEGFHQAEGDGLGRWRWTDGRGVLTARAWAGLVGPFLLELHIFRTITYRLDDEVTPSAMAGPH